MSRHLANTLTEAFWQPSIWLPPNSTWSDIEIPRKAQFGHLAYPLPMAFILMVVRFFLDRALYRYLQAVRCKIELILKYLVSKTNWESPWCEGQKEEAAQAECCTGSCISMREIGLQISVFRHRHVGQADQCLDEDEKSSWKVSVDLVGKVSFKLLNIQTLAP